MTRRWWIQQQIGILMALLIRPILVWTIDPEEEFPEMGTMVPKIGMR